MVKRALKTRPIKFSTGDYLQLACGKLMSIMFVGNRDSSNSVATRGSAAVNRTVANNATVELLAMVLVCIDLLVLLVLIGLLVRLGLPVLPKLAGGQLKGWLIASQAFPLHLRALILKANRWIGSLNY
jgi:hypothetical protein